MKLKSFPEFCLTGIDELFRSFSSGPENDELFLCFFSLDDRTGEGVADAVTDPDPDADDKDDSTLELSDDNEAKCTSACAFLLLEKNGTFILTT